MGRMGQCPLVTPVPPRKMRGEKSIRCKGHEGQHNRLISEAQVLGIEAQFYHLLDRASYLPLCKKMRIIIIPS